MVQQRAAQQQISSPGAAVAAITAPEQIADEK